MSEDEKKWRREIRAKTHFKFYSEQYLIGGSTRIELLPDERSVWLDFLCLGSLNFGKVEIFDRDATAAQLIIYRELLDRGIKKFLRFKKVSRKYDKKQKKEIFTILKWSQYQAPYLTKRLKKSDNYEEKKRFEKNKKTDAEKILIPYEMRPDHTIPNEKRGNEAPQGSQIEESFISHLNSISDSFRGISIEEGIEFLSLLSNCKRYPFSVQADALLFAIVSLKNPNVDIIYQLKKKIEWWKKKAGPKAIKCKPRTQILDHFLKAFPKNKPECVGTIAKKIVMDEETKDKIAWIENDIRRNEAK